MCQLFSNVLFSLQETTYLITMSLHSYSLVKGYRIWQILWVLSEHKVECIFYNRNVFHGGEIKHFSILKVRLILRC